MHCFFYMRHVCTKHFAVQNYIRKHLSTRSKNYSMYQYRKSHVYSSRKIKSQSQILYCNETLSANLKCSVGHIHNDVPQVETISLRNVPNMVTTGYVMNQVRTSLTQGEMTASELIEVIDEVLQACYSDISTLPWLHSHNIGTAFLQLVANDKVETILGPVIKHEVLQQVLDRLRLKMVEVPDKDCPSLLFGLISLGVDETDPLVVKLLDRLGDYVGSMDISHLAKVTESLKILQKRHFPLIMLVIHRLQEMAFDGTESNFIQSFCFLNTNLLNYMSKELLDDLSDRFLEVIERLQRISCPSDIGVCLNYCRKVHFGVGLRGKENALKIAQIAIQSIPKVEKELEDWHIAKYCHNLKKMHLYNGPVVSQLREKSSERLSDSNICIRDIVDCSFAFSRDCSSSVRKMIAALVLHNMDDIDVLNLSNLCEIMLDIHLFEPALLETVHMKTLEHFSNLSLHMSVFGKVLYLLSKIPTKDSEFKVDFMLRLKGLTEGIHGHYTKSLCKITLYMLPNTKHTIPQVLMDRLLVVIPQCNLKLASNILDGLNLMQKPWLRELHNQVLDLRICIQKNIAQRIDDVSEVETVIKLLKSAYLHAAKKDTAVLQVIMTHLPNVTKSLTSVQFNLLVTVLKRLNYYHPEVFEDLLRHISESDSPDNLQSLLNLVGLISKTGYIPKDSEAFATVCSNILETLLSEDPEKALALAFDLSLLQIYPEASLSQMFSMEFLERLDERLNSRPEIRDHLENLMMKLNRSVVLECPQLDVPWFHDEYCANRVRSKPKSSYFFELDVAQILSDELGAKDFFKTGVFTPYFYYINFELLLGSENQIVPMSSCSSETNIDPNFQRVAVLLQHDVNFCTRSFHLKSYHLSKIRHLEILGYKVVPVPLYEWTSMALTEPAERAKYLIEKISS